MTFFLDSYAARSCAVKTHNHFNPRVDLPVGEDDPALDELFEGGLAYEEQVLRRLLADFDGTVADLRPLNDEPGPVQTDASLAAMAEGVEVIIGPLLPADPMGHRSGRPDLLVRGQDNGDRHGYHPVEVKFHKVHERRKSGRNSTWTLPCSPATNPRPEAAEQIDDVVFRTSREADLLQVAHYWRLLGASGHAAGGRPTAGVIGIDDVLWPGSDDTVRVVTWVDLEEPFLRTFSRSAESGWTKRSVLERYDHEHGFRVQVARNALAQNRVEPPPPLVHPIVVKECRTCPWWAHCRPLLDDDDISLRIDRSPLDVREIGALRQLGIRTITDLAGVDADELMQRYLPEVSHKDQAEERLRLAVRRANLLVRGVTLERLSTPRIELPEVDIEIDFDIETSSDDRVYLWGFLVTDRRTGAEPEYVHVSAWEDLDDAAEAELAHRAARWLLDRLEGDASVRIYHYSHFEAIRLRQLADRTGDPVLARVCDHIDSHFVDLYAVVKQQWFGTNGLGLKVLAAEGPGFTWRDDAPGGLNSQAWFDEASHADDPSLRDLARVRVLEYNEDDVRATHAVRAWLREND
ncbi:TM0106 family RecB-like putative nuclease [Enemella sp. A6]|uniref:TM0106 family RecB-like putative nuclease n=1 Tax=Enemella sp. A6 TaxID=3440152 RepID=UPI003EB7174E